MHGVFPAGVAKFLGLQALGVLPPILGGGVVPVLAIVTLQRDEFAHGVWSLLPFWLRLLLDDLGYGAGADGVAAFANREAQALFQ